MANQDPAPDLQRPPAEPGRGEETARASGIVSPRPLKWHQRLAASLAYALIRAVSLTQRYRWEYHPAVLAPNTGPYVFCIWHNRLPLSLIMYHHYARRKRQLPRLAAMTSASRDGGVVARVLEHFGVEPVRGSSSRRGPQALLELTTWAERGYDLAVTPDGPRGPRYVVQSGAVSLAQLTGQALVPASCYFRWKLSLRSWDRFQIPLPFGRGIMKFGQPLHIPRDATEEERELLRRQLEQRLNDLTVD